MISPLEESYASTTSVSFANPHISSSDDVDVEIAVGIAAD